MLSANITMLSENAFKDLYVHWEDKIKEILSLYNELIDNKKES